MRTSSGILAINAGGVSTVRSPVAGFHRALVPPPLWMFILNCFAYDNTGASCLSIVFLNFFEFSQTNLAVSLHAPLSTKRSVSTTTAFSCDIPRISGKDYTKSITMSSVHLCLLVLKTNLYIVVAQRLYAQCIILLPDLHFLVVVYVHPETWRGGYRPFKSVFSLRLLTLPHPISSIPVSIKIIAVIDSLKFMTVNHL